MGKDDIAQELRLLALEALEGGKYDPTKQTLGAFLYVHLKNRLINMHRDRVHRTDAPCVPCHRASLGSGGETCEEGDGDFCEKYRRWRERNYRKASLMRPYPVENAPESNFTKPSTAEETAEIAEILRVIDEELDMQLRADWLRIRAGVKLSKPKRLAVEQAVLDILAREGVFLSV